MNQMQGQANEHVGGGDCARLSPLHVSQPLAKSLDVGCGRDLRFGLEIPILVSSKFGL